MPQIVWGAHPDGHFDYYNHRWFEITGRPEGTVDDEIWNDVIHPDDRDHSLSRWHAALASGDAYEVEHRLKGKSGEYRWYLARALPVRNGEHLITRWLGTCTDIHERKGVEDRLRSSLQSNRELEEFASVASHDLQEPLRKIQSFASFLQDEQSTNLNAEGRDYLARIQSAATRMRTLISDLLEFSRLAAKGRPFLPVDLNAVVAEVLTDLETRLRETSGHVEVQPLPTVFGDALQLRQLLQNLLGNALKFHEPGQVPAVQVSAELIAGLDASGRARPGGTCRISVADNGIGFDEKYLDRVFTIFQRLHGRSEYEGTGIGLAICRKIAERHSGAITAQSRPGHGATFIVTLPLPPG